MPLQSVSLGWLEAHFAFDACEATALRLIEHYKQLPPDAVDAKHFVAKEVAHIASVCSALAPVFYDESGVKHRVELLQSWAINRGVTL